MRHFRIGTYITQKRDKFAVHIRTEDSLRLFRFAATISFSRCPLEAIIFCEGDPDEDPGVAIVPGASLRDAAADTPPRSKWQRKEEKEELTDVFL